VNTSILGERLRRLQAERGWSQAQLATELGIHQKQVSGYERSIRIAETFGVCLDYLAFADRELLEKLQAIEKLHDSERAVVKSVLETYITKHRIQQLTAATEPAA
jgi:transcriptional regulator with XRE-family HTH domain